MTRLQEYETWVKNIETAYHRNPYETTRCDLAIVCASATAYRECWEGPEVKALVEICRDVVRNVSDHTGDYLAVLDVIAERAEAALAPFEVTP